MTHARIYQQGVKAFFEAKPLGGNPFDSAINSEAHEAWRDGWLDANHSQGRLYASLAAMRAYVSKSALPWARHPLAPADQAAGALARPRGHFARPVTTYPLDAMAE